MSAATSDVILKINNVSKLFGPVAALKNMHLTVRAGRVHTLLGENGAGKSTLMKILAGVYSATTGEVEFCGAALDRGDQPLTEHGPQVVGQRHTQLVALGGREEDEDAGHRLRGRPGVEGAEHEVAGFGGREGGGETLGIAHFADHDDVGILPQHVPQRGVE